MLLYIGVLVVLVGCVYSATYVCCWLCRWVGMWFCCEGGALGGGGAGWEGGQCHAHGRMQRRLQEIEPPTLEFSG